MASQYSPKAGIISAAWQGIALAVVPLFLVILSLLVARGFEETAELRGEVVRSYETRAELQRLLSLHQDLETGQRGFVLTSDPEFLEPYQAGQRDIGLALQRLRDRLRDYPEFADELAALSEVSERKRRFAHEAVQLTRSGDAQSARRLVVGGEGRALMDRLRMIIAQVDGHEQARLARRTADSDAARERLRGRSISLQLFLVLLLALAASIVFRHSRARAAATRQAEDLAARQAAIYDAAQDGMIVLNPSGSIESLNPAAARMFGYEDSQLHRRDVGVLFDAAPERGAVESFLKRLNLRRREGSSDFQEFVGRCRDGSTFPAEVSISPVQLAEDVRFLAVLRNVTERKQVERMKTEFVSTVSHELRTPLTSIAGSLGLIVGGAAGEVPPRAKRLVEIAQSNCARLVRLINDILDIEKMEAGRMTFDVKPIPLTRLLDQAVQANTAYAAEQGAMILLEPVPSGATVLGDEDRLMQVMTNLLSNAAKFSPQGGVVQVLAAEQKEQWRVSVVDEGPGIAEDFQTKIFGKFAQADSSDTRQKGGTGLGLSIVREIVTRLGGSVSFETEPGKGTTFHVDLPAAPGSSAVRSEPEALDPLDDSGQPLILHVDDDPDMLRVVADLFEGRAQVHSTPSVVEARAALRRFHFDAVILDVGMEDGSGLDLVPLVRDRGGAVIVFTAQEVEPDRRAGVDAILVKSRATLEQLVQEVLRLAQRSPRTEGGEE